MMKIFREKARLIAAFAFMVMFFFVHSSVLFSQTIVSSTTPGEIQDLMRNEGYAVEVDADGDLLWKVDGYRTWMFVQNEGSSLQFYTTFTSNQATLQKLNDFNADHKYMRTFFNKKGNPCLEADLDLAGGVTRDRILDYLKTCKWLLNKWLPILN